MRSALLILLLCAAADLIACGLLVAVVWVEHRRMRKEAAATGEMIPSAAGQLGCLIAFGLLGLVAIYGAVWLLLDFGV
jgi:hypothetical protein